MNLIKRHTILFSATAKEALKRFNELQLKEYFTLFVLNPSGKLIGTLSDGDIRRGLVDGKSINEQVSDFMYKDFKSILHDTISPVALKRLREQEYFLIPCIDKKGNLTGIIDLHKQRNKLPIDAVLMAGGKGKRLLPLTEKVPKSLLKIGGRPIIEYNILNLLKYGIENIYVCVNHLKQPLINYLSKQDYSSKIIFVEEKKELGTFGALSLIKKFTNRTLLVMNSDLLTNVDLEDLYLEYINSNAKLTVAATSYSVNIPYAVLKDSNGSILSLKEKPTETFMCNAGIYLLDSKLVSQVPNRQFFNATDFIEKSIKNKHKVITYSMLCYWLDIGKMEDYRKAQEDIKHLKF